MIVQSDIINAISQLSTICKPNNESLQAAINKTYLTNNWLTNENYNLSINNWLSILSKDSIKSFCKPYQYTSQPKKVGIIMAGNIPMVGFHDLLCVLLSGHIAIVKPSSDDKYVIPYLISELTAILPALRERIEVGEKLDKIDAVIATGSNNSFRYFEYYFRDIPSLLRKNRKSFAILSGNESESELDLLANDVFMYFGLGCRNVSLLFLPKDFEVTKVLDRFMTFSHLANHNRYANNYTYHRAMLLMNSSQHLDTGFALFQEKRDLNAPLSIVYYSFYNSKLELEQFISEQKENIQCIVGKNNELATVDYGMSQEPGLQDFADNVDTMQFLNKLDCKIQLFPEF